MNQLKRVSILNFFITFAMIALLAFPVRVLAEGDVPTEIPPPAESTPAPQTTSGPAVVSTEPTTVPVEPTAVPVEPTAVPVEPTVVPVEPTAVPVELTVVLVEPTAVPVEPTVVPVEPTAVPANPIAVIVEPNAVVQEAPTIAQTVDSLQNVNAVLVDSTGNTIPLASVQAASVLTAPDPIGCPPGTTPTWMGGTGSGCTVGYTSVQSAINDAMVVNGWTVYLQPGTYHEQVTVNSNITLFGHGNVILRAPAIMTANNIGGVDNFSLITVSGTTNALITGLTLEGLGANIADGNPAILAGITFINATGTVLNTFIQNFNDPSANQEGVGIVVYESDNVNIWNNTIANNETGVLVQNSTNTNIKTNIIRNNTNIGIKITESSPSISSGIQIVKNDILDNINFNLWENIVASISSIYADRNYFGVPKNPSETFLDRARIFGFTGEDELTNIKNNSQCSGGDCKSLNAECKINNSDKYCCPGLVCSLFNDESGNGKCCPQGQAVLTQNGDCTTLDVVGCMNPAAGNYNPNATKDNGTCTCANGASNWPTCNQCANGASNWPTCNQCANGASNWPTCDQCANGASNWPTCDQCANGASNWPTCDTCASGEVENSDGNCVAACTNSSANNYGEPAPCTYNAVVKPALIPVLVIPVTGSQNQIASGSGHTCAVTEKTGLHCWGENDFGQLGNGTYKNSNVPVNVKNVNPRAVISLAAGSKHTCALLSSGEVMCWGLNESGQLGDGTNQNRNIPVKVAGLKGNIVSITAGFQYTCAMNDQNETMCWGANDMGQLANGSSANANVPVLSNLSGIKLISGAYNELQAITSSGGLAFYSNSPAIPVTGMTSDVALVSGNRFDDGGCVLDFSGNVKCWGSIKGSGISDALLTNLLSTGQSHACVQTSKGLVCWGMNTHGQLGNGTSDNSESPVAVKDIQNVIALAAGSNHTCAIVDPETVKCWGSNEFGQLGNGTFEDSLVPVLVK